VIRYFRAFVWLRWRLLANSMRGAKRRDTLEQVSRALALLTPVILMVMSLGLVVATSVLAFTGGRSAANGLFSPQMGVFILRIALAIMLAVLALFAIIVPSQTSLTRYTRLLLLPIPRRVLHLIEVAASLADPWLLWIIPGVLAFAVGVAAGGRPAAGLVAAVAAIALIFTFAAINSLLSFLVAWLIRNRRRSEIFTLVFVVGISAVSLLPALFAGGIDRRESGSRGRQEPFSVTDFDRRLPAWTAGLPTELYGRAVLGAMREDSRAVTAGLAGLAIEFGILLVLSGLVHNRLLDTPMGGRRRSSRDTTQASVFQLPLLGPRASAVAWAQFRTAMRSVRGRLMLVLSGPMIAVLVLIVTRVEPDEKWPRFLLAHGYFMLGAGGIFALYALQPFTMNLFGTDRGGLTSQFLLPLDDAEIARGKIAGCLLLLMPTMALTLVAAAAVAPSGSPFYWAAAFLGVIATFLWLSPIGVWLSALFPQAADLSRTGSGGNPHALPMFLGTVLVALIAAPAALIVVIGAFWLHQPLLTLGVMGFWTLLAAGVAHPLVVFASRAITMRRENLSMIAQGK
jgi:hypothetical protein